MAPELGRIDVPTEVDEDRGDRTDAVGEVEHRRVHGEGAVWTPESIEAVVQAAPGRTVGIIDGVEHRWPWGDAVVAHGEWRAERVQVEAPRLIVSVLLGPALCVVG